MAVQDGWCMKEKHFCEIPKDHSYYKRSMTLRQRQSQRESPGMSYHNNKPALKLKIFHEKVQSKYTSHSVMLITETAFMYVC